MEFGILGPLHVRDGNADLHVGGVISQRILVTLLLNANRVVPVSTLAATAWDDGAPRTAHRQVQNRVAALRTLLIRNGTVVETHNAGYRIRVRPEELDVLVFDRLVDQARTEADPRAAASTLRTALALCRGPALAGLRSGALEHDALRLDEKRLAVLADCVDLELAAGRHAELLPELRQLVSEYPLRERFAGQSMVALARAGQPGAALTVYREARQHAIDELGIEPGVHLQELHRAVLRSELDGSTAPAQEEPTAAPAPAPAPPRQQPGDVPAFTGRTLEVARISELLGGAGDAGPVAIVAIHGSGGVGKSALAIHLAHRLSDRFADGQLYVDLHGATAGLQPLEPVEVLGQFLRALGLDPGRIPADTGEAAARFRSEVAERRLLIVLDNARDAAQVVPLLPGSASCAVLITSRRILTSLDGAHHVPLDVLSERDAVTQLARLVGHQRIADDLAAAQDVARSCGYLPLALRVASARLAARPGWSLRFFATRLTDAQRRLDELELTDLSVRASLAVSHQELRDSHDQLDQAAADAFVVLSLWDGPDVSVGLAARLLDLAEPRTERVLERLVDANLLETPAPGRYRQHDLLRLYAREQAADRTRQERVAALTRAIGWYTGIVWRTFSVLRPGDQRPAGADPRWTAQVAPFTGVAGALDWLEAERPNLMAAVRQAAATPGIPAALAIQLAQALYAFFRLRNYWNEVYEASRVALDVAERIGDRAAQATALNDHGAALCQLERYGEAADRLHDSIKLHEDLDDRCGLAQALGLMGNVHQAVGEHDLARACYEESLAIHEALGNVRGQAMSLGNLGPLHRRQGRYAEALDCHERAMALFRRLGDRYGQAVGLNNLGSLYQEIGRYERATECLRESLLIYRNMGDRFGQAEVYRGLGVVYREQQRYRDALAYQNQALVILRELGRRDSLATSLWELGLNLRALGDLGQARRHWQEAATLFTELGSPEATRVRALLAGEAEPA